MRPWTVILYGFAPVEVMLPNDSDKALAAAFQKFSAGNVIAILPGTFKNRIILNNSRINS